MEISAQHSMTDSQVALCHSRLRFGGATKVAQVSPISQAIALIPPASKLLCCLASQSDGADAR